MCLQPGAITCVNNTGMAVFVKEHCVCIIHTPCVNNAKMAVFAEEQSGAITLRYVADYRTITELLWHRSRGEESSKKNLDLCMFN